MPNHNTPSVSADAAGKLCRTCGVTKPLTSFPWRNKHKGHKGPNCKACHVKQTAADRKRDPNKRRDRDRLHKYGLTPEAHAVMFRKQNGCCAICFRPETRTDGRPLSVDHNHTTGEARGLLCHSCNVAIGLLQDNPVYARTAALYLEERGHYGTTERNDAP